MVNTLICVIAHDPLASALLKTAEHVFGPQKQVFVYDIKPDVCPDTQKVQILNDIEVCMKNDETISQVLFLSDLIGATPNNIGACVVEVLHAKGIASHIFSGASVAMLLQAIEKRSKPLDELCNYVIDRTFKGIRCTDKCSN
ncbi:PTS sugar transporter subunit IIA [Basilea psittacipulmonis]|uniref:PTS sugar transporter subunit IIA n=1 Tax=Basilea psittacipulmonis TaxID=1472345 RepID=UPI000691C053|nr:hypothetical protein [Basilea psittacipulmonis]